MTPKQNALYWREWAAVARMAGDEAIDELRHELHAKALGHDKSHKDFDNRDLDLVLAAFRAVSRPADVDAQLRQMNMPRRRMLWRIREQIRLLGVFVEDPDAYVGTILKERFWSKSIENLSDLAAGPYRQSDLKHFLMTLSGRVDRMRQDAGLSVREMHDLAKGKKLVHA